MPPNLAVKKRWKCPIPRIFRVGFCTFRDDSRRLDGFHPIDVFLYSRVTEQHETELHDVQTLPPHFIFREDRNSAVLVAHTGERYINSLSNRNGTP